MSDSAYIVVNHTPCVVSRIITETETTLSNVSDPKIPSTLVPTSLTGVMVEGHELARLRIWDFDNLDSADLQVFEWDPETAIWSEDPLARRMLPIGGTDNLVLDFECRPSFRLAARLLAVVPSTGPPPDVNIQLAWNLS